MQIFDQKLADSLPYDIYWNSMTESEQAHMAPAMVFELSKVSLEHIRLKMLSQLRVLHEDLAKRMALGLAMDLPVAAKPFKKPLDLPVSDALSIQKNWHASLQGPQVALLFDEGSDSSEIDALRKPVTAENDTVLTIAPMGAALP